MHLVERAKDMMVATGAEWVLWLLVVLSVISLTMILERLLALRVLRADVDAMRTALVGGLRQGGFARGREVMAKFRHPAARIVQRAMIDAEWTTTSKQAEDVMAAETIAQRRMLEKRFNFLATLGANAPFIGLFGTVVGILQAFEGLGRAGAAQAAGAMAPQAVMSSIAEALVATAVGLGVAIPAVFAYNLFQRWLRSAFDDARMLSLEVVAWLDGQPARSPAASREPARAEREPARDRTSAVPASRPSRSVEALA